MKKMKTLNMEISEIEQQVKAVDERNHSLGMKKEDVMQELEGLRVQVEASQRIQRQLLKEQEIKKEELNEFMGNRYFFFHLVWATLTILRESNVVLFR